MDYQKLKKEYERIGGGYTVKVLSGYIDFFTHILSLIADKRNMEYRINRLRLLVYRALLKEK